MVEEEGETAVYPHISKASEVIGVQDAKKIMNNELRIMNNEVRGCWVCCFFVENGRLSLFVAFLWLRRGGNGRLCFQNPHSD